MHAFRSREVVRSEGYEIRVEGAPPPNLRDAYHVLLGLPAWAAALVVSVAFLALNAGFALAYLAVGGIANAAPGSFLDAFFFSVQTMATIGYGAMYPVTRAANALVVVEAVAGLLATALAAGLAFARFSQLRARVAFSSRLAIGPMDGVPCLQARVGNERRGRIVDATVRLSLVRLSRTAEGVAIYRTLDLPLVRDRAGGLARAWLVLHRIVPGSPLDGATPASLVADEAELTLEVNGVDEISGQPVHAARTWTARSVVFGARLADVLSEAPDGNLVLDLRAFHRLEPTAPAPGFPYPAEAGAPGPRG